MDVCMRNVERENQEMRESLRDLEADKQHLHDKTILLEKALEKEKKNHRKFADDVTEIEKIRNADFKKEKHEYVEENKSLRQKTKQLAKDVEFYKKAHEELAKVVQSTVQPTATNCPEPSNTIESNPEDPEQRASNYRRSNKHQDSSKKVVKINLMLYEENKKLQSKIKDFRSTVSDLKKKIKQLESVRNKIDNKRNKFCQDSEELQRLVDLSRKKNRDTYTPEVLSMLGNLAKNKK